MTGSLTLRPELDRLRCDEPGCTEEHGPIVLASRCHEDAPMWAVYDEGELCLECAECGESVLTIAVAG